MAIAKPQQLDYIVSVLAEIAGYIDKLRKEIGALQANDLHRERIPAAGQELDAVVRATESATNTIMECVEAVLESDATDPATYKAFIEERMTVIIEACSFQDLTGQRIAKVVETLQHIEARVARFARETKVDDAHGHTSKQEAVEAKRKSKGLIHGPASSAEANSQAEIDKLFR